MCKLEGALTHHDTTALVISKQRSLVVCICDIADIITNKSLKETVKINLMENRLYKVHISYKHDDTYEYALKAIITGLQKNGIQYSIDKRDIQYRDNIDEYEKEIGASDRVIMFMTPTYFKSLDCMFEMTQMFKNGNVRERIFPVVDMGEIPRDGKGLTQIKEHWNKEMYGKIDCVKNESGGSGYLLKEVGKINDIIETLDDFWAFICRNSTGDFKALIENDAALLMKELKEALPQNKADIDDEFIPSEDIKPVISRNVSQSGEKSIYIEKNMGSITIN